MLVAQSKNSSTTSVTHRYHTIVPCAFLLGMATAWIIVDAVLPLRSLYFASAQLIPLSQRFLQPSRILFPGRGLSPFLFSKFGYLPYPTSVGTWQETGLLLCTFLLLFFCYFLALKYLPQRVGIRFILISACLLGSICMLIPIVTSVDLLSYIMYARMETLYHLNPLAALPVAKDPVYKYLYWKDQPSAYGPTWILLSSLLQWSTSFVSSTRNISVMVLAFRLLGLLAHLWSTLLVWSISRHLQHIHGTDRFSIRVLATLAFAWNPLLLFEACVNAHNDTVMLLFILLAFWFLVRRTSLLSYACVALMLALATCLKANAALLLPGLLIFLWLQPQGKRALSTVLLVYLGTVVLLYAPFWDRGAILNLLNVNPGTFRNENSIPDFVGQLYNAIRHLLGHPRAADIGSRAERVAHTLSLGAFVLAYAFLCWQALFTRHRLQNFLQLIRWTAIAWFLYCLLGAPWFWPWYAVTFFGIFALIEASEPEDSGVWSNVNIALAVRIFAFCLLSSYCFVVWGVFNSFVPFLSAFRWAYLRGVWIWLPVLFLFFLQLRSSSIREIWAGPRMLLLSDIVKRSSHAWNELKKRRREI